MSNILDKIKELFSKSEGTEMKFIDVKTADGRIMRTEEVQPDYKVTEITEEGEIDVEPGTYVLEGNIEIVVGEGSIITDVREVEVVEEEMEKKEEEEEEEKEEMESEEEKEEEVESEEKEEEKEEEMEVTPEEQTAIITEVMQILEPRIAALEASIAELKAMMVGVTEEFNEFSKAPADAPTDTRVKFTAKDKNSKLQFFAKR
jgi:TATA-binding protein-associated factor Taf7